MKQPQAVFHSAMPLSAFHVSFHGARKAGKTETAERLAEVRTMEVVEIPAETLRAIQKAIIRYDVDQIVDFEKKGMACSS